MALDKQKLVDGILALYENVPISTTEAVSSWYNLYHEYTKSATLGSGMDFIDGSQNVDKFKSEMLLAVTPGTPDATTHFDEAFGNYWLPSAFSPSGGLIPAPPVTVFGSLKAALDAEKLLNEPPLVGSPRDEAATAEFFSNLIDTYTKLCTSVVFVPGSPPTYVTYQVS